MRQVTGAVVGAGTVLNARMLGDALGAGAEFIVSPGLTDSLGQAAVAAGIPFLPGIANASNIMAGLDIGLTSFKFFSASTRGGVAALQALTWPFRGNGFLPTGGPNEQKSAGSGKRVRISDWSSDVCSSDLWAMRWAPGLNSSSPPA